jgi:hypothetical protein
MSKVVYSEGVRGEQSTENWGVWLAEIRSLSIRNGKPPILLELTRLGYYSPQKEIEEL